MTWTEQARCKGMNTELFFPWAGEGTELYERQVQAAKTVCAQCPLETKLQCLLFGLDQEFGVYGGTTPGERRKWANQRINEVRTLAWMR